MFDLCKKEGKTLKELLDSSFELSSPRPPKIGRGDDREIDRRALTENFFSDVRALRFPHVADKEKQFRKAAAELQSENSELHVQVPDYFEQEGIRLQMKLQNAEAFDRLVKHLQNHRNILKRLFEIML